MLIDANLLLYAVVSDYPQHKQAKQWLEEQLNGPRRVGIPWPNLLAFVRITTNPRIFTSPLSIRDAWKQINEWLLLPQVWTPMPLERHSEVLGQILIQSNAVGNLVPDAHLAALAIQHGLVLYSTDSDFTRFKDLNWMNPLD